MPIDVARLHSKSFRGSPPFRYAEVRGSGDNDHASWWSFDDEQIVRDRHWDPKPGETVLDVGAAFGSYGIPAAALGARVVFFSPADFDTELLATNLNLNPEISRRCMIVRDGVWSSDGWFDPDRCRFSEQLPTICDDCEGRGGLQRPLGGFATCARCARKSLSQWLRVRALDSFLEDHPGIGKVDWLKLDVEGAELEAFRGAEQCLRMYRPKILVENHNFQIPDMELKVRDYLVGLGLGYVCNGPHPHGSVSHSFFSAP